ncbi:MAG: hypothetical protein ACJ8AG_00910 [Ktedonobacteraceae bacterium]
MGDERCLLAGGRCEVKKAVLILVNHTHGTRSQHRDIELALSSIPIIAAPSTSWSTWSQG